MKRRAKWRITRMMAGASLRARAFAALLTVAGGVGCGTADGASSGTPVKECGKVALDGGGGIVAPADGSTAAECRGQACNYQSQAGCADGQSCLPSVADAKVIPACFDPGTKGLGVTCTAADECVHGAVCAGGQCRRLCCAGDWSVCEEGTSCFRQFDYQIGDAIVPTGAWVCYPVGTCSVLDPTACGSGQDCKLVDARGSEACIPKTAGALGEACGAASGKLCERGLACVGQPGAETCRHFCRAEECGEPSCPSAEGTCVHFDRDPAGVGECTPGW